MVTGKTNAKRVIDDLCEYFGIEEKPGNHKVFVNNIRTFNPS